MARTVECISTEEAKKLSISELILLVEEIWNSIAEENGCFKLSEAQKQELDRPWRHTMLTPHKVEHGKKSIG